MPGRDLAALADRIGAATLACPAVTGLAAGPLGTYLPGRTVPGVSIGRDRVRVAVIADFAGPLPEVADQVRAAIAPLADGLPVDVVIADIVENQGA